MIDPIELPGIINQARLEAGLALTKPGNLFPSNVARTAVTNSATVLQVLEASLATGYRPRRIELVQAPKWDTTTRPAADMAIDDQIVYTSLVEYLKDKIHPGLVTFTGIDGEGQTYREFEEYPITIDDAQYVLEADAASFYEYVDHERLAAELLGLTGEAAATNALLGLLEAWLGFQQGLPQGPSASGSLADIYIAPVSRALLRAGFRHSRFSDDFRVVARTWDEVRQGQLLLESAMRERGLVIAAGKRRTPGIARYKELFELLEQAEEEYTGDAEAEGSLSEDEIASEIELLQQCLNDTEVTIEWTRRMRRSFTKLAGSESGAALPYIPRFLNRYPHITQTFASYLTDLMEGPDEAAALKATMPWLLSSGFRYPWQIGWILHAVSFAENRDGTLGEWAAPVIFNDSYPWFVRGQAAITLAVHGRLPSQESYFNVYEAAPAATKPDLIGAIIIGSPRWRNEFLTGVRTEPLFEAASHLDGGAYRDWI
jgi:hypothetical protein